MKLIIFWIILVTAQANKKEQRNKNLQNKPMPMLLIRPTENQMQTSTKDQTLF